MLGDMGVYNRTRYCFIELHRAPKRKYGLVFGAIGIYNRTRMVEVHNTHRGGTLEITASCPYFVAATRNRELGPPVPGPKRWASVRPHSYQLSTPHRWEKLFYSAF